MSRLLYNVWGPDYCDISFALITIHPERAAWWLTTVRPMIDQRWKGLRQAGDYSFHGIKIWDWEPEFLRMPSWYGGVLPEEIVEKIKSNKMVELPDDLILEKPKVEHARMDSIIAHVDRSGIVWRGREKHTDYEIETPCIIWKHIRERAEAPEPANNDGRMHCWWCGTRTEEMTLFTSTRSRCAMCGK